MMMMMVVVVMIMEVVMIMVVVLMHSYYSLPFHVEPVQILFDPCWNSWVLGVMEHC